MSDEYIRECCKCKTVKPVILCKNCSKRICNDCYGKDKTLCCNLSEETTHKENVSPNKQKTCKKCGNVQPMSQICVKCNRTFKFFCVGDEECWNISSDRKNWECLRCASTKYNEEESDESNLEPQEEGPIEDLFSILCMAEDELFQDDGDGNICQICKNIQPVCRTCCKCQKSYKYFCVDYDCWRWTAVDKGYFWMCLSCLPNITTHNFFSSKTFHEISTTEALQFIRREKVYNVFKSGNQLVKPTQDEAALYDKFKKKKEHDDRVLKHQLELFQYEHNLNQFKND